MAQQIEGCRKAKAAGFAMSVTAILGIGGDERTHEHAIGTGKALSAIDPEYIGILSLMLESGTEMTEAVRSGPLRRAPRRSTCCANCARSSPTST